MGDISNSMKGNDLMDILVRDIPPEVDAALKAHAEAAHMSRNEYILAQWRKLIEQPIITTRYGYRVYGKAGRGIIKRYSDDPRGTSATCVDFDAAEADALKQAEDLIRRNQPGNREEAVAILHEAFREVFEAPV